MVIKINRKSLFHYFMIYFLIIINQSCLYQYFLVNDMIRIVILIIFSSFIFKSYTKSYNKYIGLVSILLFFTILTRLLSGGIGLRAWIDYVIPIFVCVYVINYDIEHFLERFVKLVVFLAVAGLIFFFIQIINSELLKTLLPIKYNTEFSKRVWANAFDYKTLYYPGAGLFLYSYRMGEAAMRNKGIFTEPGICQMVYNSAIFILLFFSEKTHLTTRQIKRFLVILIVAIVTVQSTTGYIISVCLLVCFLLVRQKNQGNMKGYIKRAILLIILGLAADFTVRGEESFFYVAIVNKIFGNGNQLEIQGSGMARVEAILLCMGVMISNPFGVGADNLMGLIALNLADGGGAGLFKFGATAGVIPFLVCILFYLIPVIKSDLKILVKILLLYSIFYTLLAQSNPFYPVLIMFPIYLMERKRYE